MKKEYKNERYNCAYIPHCFTTYAASQLTENKYFTSYLRVGHILLICKHNPELHVEVHLNNQGFYLFHASICFINNQKKFQTNSSIRSVNSRSKRHLHRPNTDLSF